MQMPNQSTNLPLSAGEAQNTENEEAKRHQGLDELVAEAQKLGMY